MPRANDHGVALPSIHGLGTHSSVSFSVLQPRATKLTDPKTSDTWFVMSSGVEGNLVSLQRESHAPIIF